MKRNASSVAIILIALSAMAPLGHGAQSPAEALGWQLAVHSYTFQRFSIFEAIDKTSSLGLKYMSISGGVSLDGKTRTETTALAAADQEAIQKRLTAGGIVKLVNMGVVKLTTNEAQSRGVFEFAWKMGIDTLVSEPEPEAMDTVEKLCKEFDIKVAIHNHPKPSRYWNPDTVLAAVKGRSPLLGACADTGHWIRSGLDPIECVKKLEGRVICLHFKDLAESNPKTHDVPWGTGVGKNKAVMEELKRQKFKGAFCVEYEHNWENSLPEIAECVKFFNTTCAELVGGAGSK